MPAVEARPVVDKKDRCTSRPSIFLCGFLGQDTAEQVGQPGEGASQLLLRHERHERRGKQAYPEEKHLCADLPLRDVGPQDASLSQQGAPNDHRPYQPG